jgi:hypothetical protein
MAAAIGRLQLSVYDNVGNKGSVLSHLNVDDGQTLAACVTAIGAYATAFGAISTAGIERGSFTIIDFAAAADPATDAYLPSGAVFDFDNAAVPTIYGQYVPSFLDSLVSAGGHIDTAGTEVAAWGTLLTGAVLGGHYASADYRNNRALVDAFQSARKRSRRVR